MGIPLEMVCDPATTICAKACISHFRVTVPAANILAIEVFGTNIFTDILCHKRGTDLILCLPLLSSYPTVSSPKFQDMGTGLI